MRRIAKVQQSFIRAGVVVLFVVALGAILAAPLSACPFCQAVKTTLREDIEASDVAALAELIARPDRPDPGEGVLPAADAIDAYKAIFRIVKIYKGAQHVEEGQRTVAIYTGSGKPGALCLLRGAEPKALQWAPPLELSQRAQVYVEKVIAFPEHKIAERLQFLEPYLEDSDTLLRNDAFDEFAQADYEALRKMKDAIDHDRLIGWIKNPEVRAANRRLYFTMLGVCGKPGDEKLLAAMLASGDRVQMTGLDALIACYLSLAGAEGLPLVERLFLRSGNFWDPEFVHTNSAILALRFHGQEKSPIPRERLLASMRVVLERPELADLVIGDLARWKDWESMAPLVTLFKEAKNKKSWVRVPVLRFLQVCPLPEAKQHLAELSKLDPDAARRAATFFPFAPKPTGKPSASTDAVKDAAPKDPE